MNISARKVASRYLPKALRQAGIGVRLDPKTRRQINAAFGRVGLDERGNFEKAEHGYSKAWEVLGEFNVVVDTIIDSHIFRDARTDDGRADDGHTNLHLAMKTDDPFTNIPITNSMLVFTFHRKETGKFGCLVYVS